MGQTKANGVFFFFSADGTKLPFSLGVTLCGSVAGLFSTEHELHLNRGWTSLCFFAKGTHFRNDEWPRLKFANKTWSFLAVFYSLWGSPGSFSTGRLKMLIFWQLLQTFLRDTSPVALFQIAVQISSDINENRARLDLLRWPPVNTHIVWLF